MKIDTVINDAGTFEIHSSEGHGKATKGDKKTSSIQVRQPMRNGYLLLNTVSFPVDDKEKMKLAIEKSRKYIDEM